MSESVGELRQHPDLAGATETAQWRAPTCHEAKSAKAMHLGWQEPALEST